VKVSWLNVCSIFSCGKETVAVLFVNLITFPIRPFTISGVIFFITMTGHPSFRINLWREKGHHLNYISVFV